MNELADPLAVLGLLRQHTMHLQAQRVQARAPGWIIDAAGLVVISLVNVAFYKRFLIAAAFLVAVAGVRVVLRKVK